MDHREMSSRNRVQVHATYSSVVSTSYLQLYLFKNTWSLVMTPQAGQSSFETLKQINTNSQHTGKINHAGTLIMTTY